MATPSSLTVMTLCRLELELRPVAMPIMPSSNNDAWLAFIKRGEQSYSFRVSAEDVERIQEFMIEHSTECLSDGNRNYTICGHSLVACFPEAIDREMVRVYEHA